MNGASSQPGNSSVGLNAEDIDSILGRFQDWASAHRDQSALRDATNSGSGRSPASRKANLRGGVRERSYEQALRASNRRRQTYPEAAKTSPQAAKSDPIAVPQAELPPSGSTTGQLHAVERRAEASPQLETIASVGPTNARSTRSRASRIEAGAKAANISAARGTIPKSPVSTTECQHTQPTFGQVLKGRAGLAATAILETRSVALSLRVSDIEQARIQACAARANLSVSAYLRQCALGVDELRDQVELALAQLHKQDAKSTSPPGLSAIPAILSHFAARLFRWLRGNHDYTAISLH